jgi:YVTN family beta-propeller protein
MKMADESLVYVSKAGSNTVSVINTATNTVIATIPVGTVPLFLAVSPDGTRLQCPTWAATLFPSSKIYFQNLPPI